MGERDIDIFADMNNDNHNDKDNDIDNFMDIDRDREQGGSPRHVLLLPSNTSRHHREELLDSELFC